MKKHYRLFLSIALKNIQVSIRETMVFNPRHTLPYDSVWTFVSPNSRGLI